MDIWRSLDSDEKEKFKAGARKNYKPFSEINGTWHPVYQEECVKINNEYHADNKTMEKSVNNISNYLKENNKEI